MFVRNIKNTISLLVKPVVLRVKDVTLRPIGLSNFRKFAALFSDRSEHHLLWKEIPQNPLQSLSILGKNILKKIRGSSCLFAIELDGEMVGVIGFRKISKEDYTGELIAFIKKEVRGKGIASGILRRVLSFGFSELDLNRIYFYVDPRNANIRQTMEKYKPLVVEEGLLRQNERIRGKFVDDIVYSILKEDWLEFLRSQN